VQKILTVVWVSAFAGAAAGPFTVHFWAPMSKWLISGASFLDLNRPTELVSITQVGAQARVCIACAVSRLSAGQETLRRLVD